MRESGLDAWLDLSGCSSSPTPKLTVSLARSRTKDFTIFMPTVTVHYMVQQLRDAGKR